MLAALQGTALLAPCPPLPPPTLPPQGLFLPANHSAYWMGLAGSLADGIVELAGMSNRTWAWIDGVTPPPGIDRNYVHWGNWTVRRQVVSAEPNNWHGNESCAVANSSTGYRNAYGWGDERCSTNMTSICKTQREWLGLAAQLAATARYIVCMAWLPSALPAAVLCAGHIPSHPGSMSPAPCSTRHSVQARDTN
jgi:hypothetical protein